MSLIGPNHVPLPVIPAGSVVTDCIVVCSYMDAEGKSKCAWLAVEESTLTNVLGLLEYTKFDIAARNRAPD